MSNLINAKELIAEIDRQEIGYNIDGKHTAEYNTCIKILDIINSLQQEQPEVELDREIIKYKVPFTDEREYLNETTLDAIARHFYKLGCKAKKYE